MYHYEVDEAVLKREKAAARELRHSRWWQNLIANRAQCRYCKVALTKDEATMDHIVPLSRGGRSVKNNVAISCKPCNNAKKDQLLLDWTSDLSGTGPTSDTLHSAGFHHPSDES